jgi:GT2 family glycosyltransferase
VSEQIAYAIVVVTHDHAETLDACLAAVEGLRPAPAQVMVIDNASSDGSAHMAENHSGDVVVTTLREERNTGFAAAANRGIAATSEPWVLLLNPDCAPRPDLVAALVAAVMSRPEAAHIGAVSPKLLRAEGPALEPSEVFDGSAWVFGGTAAAILLRREALDDVAYSPSEFFAESFFAYREDAELAWRLQLRGWRCLYAPAAVAAHRRGFRPEEGRRGHAVINRYSVRNRFLLRRHCADAWWHLRCFPSWLLRDLVVIGACLTVERASLPALADVWRLRADSRRRREWVLGRRTVSPRRINRWFRRRGRVEEVEGR